MTLSFLKLHVAGHDFILIDQDKLAMELSKSQPSPSLIAELILDRRCGVGGDGCIFMATDCGLPPTRGIFTDERSLLGKGSLKGRLFTSDGREVPLSADALLCIARYALDTGRSSASVLRIQDPFSETVFELKAIDSRSFMFTIPYPRVQPLTLIVDGKTAHAYRVQLGSSYLVACAIPNGPGSKRVRQALQAMEKTNDIPLVLRLHAKDIIRYVGPERSDRIEGAIAAVLAAGFQGYITEPVVPGIEGAIVAEWRGRGGAVSYASFSQIAAPDQISGPATLIDRGRFWVNPNRNHGIQVVGKAEYVFDGSFDI
ncbi:hypothetical protein [Gracilinema caldarium]|uniref:Diaminopimelate epimerase n=1 Tax=Gracilinema caldarium (strain ATCC 51460 / DSM 7334 / H1) TaxID=744872 RepID=F8F2L7_GRAC1|nr:hypothetical protein [Gracilinema caldarium]AEJ19132.1 hypothetical protein Spica_0982 [Gracilinema caldarium DSM 7334]